MSIRRCPAPIVKYILPKGVFFAYCQKSHKQSDVSLNITFSFNSAMNFDKRGAQAA
jgi:hypothetical protein